MHAEYNTYGLAKMSKGVALGTRLLLLLAVAFVALGLWGMYSRLWPLAAAAVFIWAVFWFVWVTYRPRSFEIQDGRLCIVWPIRRREYTVREVTGVRRISRQEMGFAIRLFGAGGLWGLFGLCWSKKLGKFDAYISGRDGLVLVEFRTRRPLVITPEDPDEFVVSLREVTQPPE